MTMAAPPPPRRGGPSDQTTDTTDDFERIDAVHLAEGMVGFALEHQFVHVPDQLLAVMPLADVVRDTERFGAQYRYAQENSLPLPVLLSLEDGEYKLPVNADSAFFPMGRAAERSAAEEALFRATDAGELYPRVVKLADPDDAAESFRSRLGQFLTTRVEGVEAERERPDMTPGATPPPQVAASPVTLQGLLFEVHTRSQGLRVHYHPAYWHDSNPVFGQPSSPVTGYLQPGRWVFGAQGPNLPLRFDPAEYDVPGTSRADLYW